MRILSPLLLTVLLLSYDAVSQDKSSEHQVKPCGTTEYQEELFQKHPQLRVLQQQIEEQQTAWIEEYKNTLGTQRGVVYTIPLVFHVIHVGGVENISDSQIFNAVDLLNRDFRKLNSSVNNVHSSFQGITADIEIEFALATKAPDGTCFNGITRTFSSTTEDGSGGQQASAVVAGNDVYNGTWPGNSYLNIFVVNYANGAAGYTSYPSTNTGMTNGIWILHGYVGSIGTGTPNRATALTHEVGHWLNLRHTWGNSNTPGEAGNCNSDDGVSDTPNTTGWTSCNVNGITCDGINKPLGTVDNVENYMEYAYCSKMFTEGQKTRMRAAITNTTGGRNNIWTTTNLNQVGANGNLVACKASFEADRVIICAGETVDFSDLSYHNISGWNWSFSGGLPASSTQQNPSVTYNTPGTYDVSLQASDGTNQVTSTKSAYIIVLPATGRTAPFSEGFETMTTLPNDDWYVINSFSQDFEITSLAAASGTKSLYLNNANGIAGTKNEFLSTTIDLSGVAGVTLSFKYAFAKKNGDNMDAIQVLVSKDCGENWLVRRNISTTQITTAPNTTSNFIPGTSDWQTISITNIASSYLVPNFKFKIVYTNGGGNNLYLDDINLDVALGVKEQYNKNISQLSVFPNPTSESAFVVFSLAENSETRVTLLDMLGREVALVANGILSTGEHQFQVNRNGLAGGVYLIKAEANGEQIVKKVIFE